MKDYLRRLEYLEALANSTAPGVDPNARMRVQLQLPRIQEAKAQLQALLEQVFEDPTVLRASSARPVAVATATPDVPGGLRRDRRSPLCLAPPRICRKFPIAATARIRPARHAGLRCGGLADNWCAGPHTHTLRRSIAPPRARQALRDCAPCAALHATDDPFVLKRAMMLEAVRSAEACMSQGGSGDWGSPARGGNVPASHVPQDSMLPAGKRRRGSAGGAATRASEPSSNAQANPVLRAADAGAMGAQPLGPVPSQAAVPPWGQVAASTHAQPPAGAAAAAEMPKPAHAPLPTSGPLVAGSAPAPSGGGLSQAVGHALSASAQWARMGGMSHPMQRGFPAVAPLGYAAPHMVAMNQFEPYMALMQGLQPYADPRLAAAVPSGYAPLFAVAPTPRSGTFSFPA